MKEFDFSTQLLVGEDGEARFKALYPHLLKLDGLTGEFLTPYGEKVELKTETRGETETPNFFVEYLSNKERQTPGGPWQALKNGCEYYVWFFPKTGGIFWFYTTILISVLNLDDKPKKWKNILNKGYTTLGYTIPRASLEEYCCEPPYAS